MGFDTIENEEGVTYVNNMMLVWLDLVKLVKHFAKRNYQTKEEKSRSNWRAESMCSGTCININNIPTQDLDCAKWEKGLDFEQAMNEKCGHYSSQCKNMQHCWNWCRHYRNARRLVRFFRSSNSKAGDEGRWQLKPLLLILVLYQLSFNPRFILKRNEICVDSTGVQRLKHLAPRCRPIWWDQSDWNFAHLYNTLGGQVTVLDASEACTTDPSPSGSSCKGYLEEERYSILARKAFILEIKDGQTA